MAVQLNTHKYEFVYGKLIKYHKKLWHITTYA